MPAVVLRTFLAVSSLALVLVAPAASQRAAAAAAQAQMLMPGVSYRREVEFTRHGPVAVHVLTAPRPGGLYGLRPVLSNNTIVGTERVTAMQRTLAATATTAGINGDLFNSHEGHPAGVLIQDGELKSPPLRGRSSIGIGADGTLRVERVSLFGTWQGRGQRRPLNGLNRPPGSNQMTLYTPAWGRATPASPDTVEAVLTPFPTAAPNTDLVGTLVEIKQSGGTPIPPGGAVLAARNNQATRLQAEAPVGTAVTVRLTLKPDWRDVRDAIGGGPLLVRAGRPVFNPSEAFATEHLLPRNARSAVGQLADGRIVLVAVDGRQPGYSVGLTNFELAQTLVRLGAVTGSGLDAGGSTTMAFEGTLLNRPSHPGGERPVADALFVFYYGVYVSPPTAEVLSPNGDGIAEQQALAYKLVRPATATVTLVGPDGVARVSEAVPRNPGVYQVPFSPTREDGTPETEGRWRLVVTAVEQTGVRSTVERAFWLNNTLGFLRVPAAYRVGAGAPKLAATFTLARRATVTATVETATGAVVRTFGSATLAPGRPTIRWDGRNSNGGLAHSGSYVLRVVAVNALGRTELTRPFSVRRVAPARRPDSSS